MLVLLRDSSRYMELCGLRIEVQLRDSNRQGGVHSLVAPSTGCGFVDDLADGRGPQKGCVHGLVLPHRIDLKSACIGVKVRKHKCFPT
ncbi:hypothetical protein KC341_g5 [Hortaea werneckii]|nr:hypothetical protein KC341_g5 [Hortaea werneckii]